MKSLQSTSNRFAAIIQVVIIIVNHFVTTTESVPRYPRAKKRQIYIDFLKNRQNSIVANRNDYRSLNDNLKDTGEYDKPLNYRDFIRNEYINPEPLSKDYSTNKASYIKKNRIPKLADKTYSAGRGMKTILSLPFNKNDRDNAIRGFEPGDPAGDCLAGGVDAGVVDGELKIGIGLGLAPGCGTSTQQTPRLIPVFVPRPVPVPVGVPQPYPVAIDVPRPVAIRVPMPIPFPGMNMGPLPIMGAIQSPIRMMTGNAWGFGSWG